jgi:hypothetical protein
VPRPVVVDSRFDLRGGVNTQQSQDTLDDTEVRRALNMRQYTLGEYTKRSATRRVHVTALDGGNPILAVRQWRPTADRQLVALVGGDLYYKAYAAAEFTAVSGSALSTTARARFAESRDGSDIWLYIADGKLHRFDGTTLEEEVAGAPDAVDICLYKGRGYALVEDSKTLWISGIRDLEDWVLTQDIETYDMEPLVALCVCGSSLLLAKENSIARYTGVSQEEIRIDVESEGVAMRVGCIARHTFIELDGVCFLLSDKGPYLVSEGGVEPVGLQVAREFDFANKALWQHARAVYHAGRQEVQLSLPAAGETGNDTTWVLNLKTMKWDGPFVYPMGVSSAASLEREDGSESVLIGGYNGRVYDADVVDQAHRDDLLQDNTGGDPIACELEYPALIGGAPGLIKSLAKKHVIRADLGADGELEYAWASEMGSDSVTIASKGAGVQAYPVKFGVCKGTAIVRTLREETDNPCTIAGIQAFASIGRSLDG